MYKIIEVLFVDSEYGWYGMAEDIEKEYSALISELWQLGWPTYGEEIYITDKNGRELVHLKYNEEKKGYRPIESVEWQ